MNTSNQHLELSSLRSRPPRLSESDGGQAQLEYWNDGMMPACRQTGVLKKMGQWFIGKISLDREVNKWIIAFKSTFHYSSWPAWNMFR
ncbi:MAG: hypothetical protein JRF35_08705 [Deltaproteobacteria bacterium]|nr:hypothetical protein [Deltaproteobacteria bacterium]